MYLFLAILYKQVLTEQHLGLEKSSLGSGHMTVQFGLELKI